MKPKITKSEKEISNARDWGLIIAIALLVIGLLSVFIPFDRINGVKIGIFTINIDRYNNLGDFIGGVTTPFISIAAFILLYMTYKSQKKELAESQGILRTQNMVITKQQFENSFFNLINLHSQIRSQINATKIAQPVGFYVSSNANSIDKESFDRLYYEFRFAYHDFYANPNVPDLLKNVIMDRVYSHFYEKRQSMLGHYFRNLYHIVKFVDNSLIETKRNTQTF